MSPGHQVPLFERPERRVPPVSGRRPGSVSTLDGVSLLPENERVRLPVMYRHSDYFRRPQLPHGQALGSRFCHCCGRRGYNKGFDTKSIRAMSVFEHRLAHAALADDTANPGQGYIQPHGLWHLGRKKSKLHFAGAAWLCAQGKRQDCCLWWMCLQIQMDQLQP